MRLWWVMRVPVPVPAVSLRGVVSCACVVCGVVCVVWEWGQGGRKVWGRKNSLTKWGNCASSFAACVWERVGGLILRASVGIVWHESLILQGYAVAARVATSRKACKIRLARVLRKGCAAFLGCVCRVRGCVRGAESLILCGFGGIWGRCVCHGMP